MLTDDCRPTETLSANQSSAQPVELPAGGNDPTRFDWKEAWYPVFYLDDLDKARPQKFTLLERDLVIWWNRQTETWCAFDDQCPHRLAPLSEGRIAEDGLLECPYHGWAFQGDGTCDRIPQALPNSSAHTSPRACVASLPTAVRQGLLFVYPGNPDNALRVKVPTISPLEENPEGWICLNTFRDLPYDALTLLENVLDASHVPFTHHRSVGNRSNAAPVELEVIEATRQGFTGTWAEGPRKGTLGQQNTTFIAPSLMWHDLTSKQFGRTLTVVYATPIRKGECRIFARFPFKFASKLPAFFIGLSPRWYSHLGQNSVLEDDQIFLHHQERYLAAKPDSENVAKAFYLPTRADAFVLKLRQWVSQYCANPFPEQSLSSALKPEVLLDRYHSHTKHCASCRRALARIQLLRQICVGVAAIAWSLIPLLSLLSAPPLSLALMATTIPLLAGGIWVGLGRLERQFYEGRIIPPRNLPERKS
ncbi:MULTISPECIES: Rieske 2Fe-2S domain-containing protein [unclassified Leptolyngbya]|uniref:aromatic ring-hydroxylating dioxygenase subunit alpha n=1 Tax=unclassified Leptolyngbya TaxID=2650499 RepID=UPI0016874137|nr:MULTISPECIES: Rieske 2Fe-2S domain-containing protein [unclassified Leptolyngbya]MBD1909320.1 Rieske 2Fe-2S domain-containing protein [Leptolyngbya sp. FACHB-8]MBD2153550.1 Rieske 2Fe-2S domain-containing protein [Leptolyngbya sp. FACHB-16]